MFSHTFRQVINVLLREALRQTYYLYTGVGLLASRQILKKLTILFSIRGANKHTAITPISDGFILLTVSVLVFSKVRLRSFGSIVTAGFVLFFRRSANRGTGETFVCRFAVIMNSDLSA